MADAHKDGAVSQESFDQLSWGEPAATASEFATVPAPSPSSCTRRKRQQNPDCDITLSGEVNWSDLDQWIKCVCVVTFDLERGQSIEHVYPPRVQLDPADLKAIGFLSFPDSNSGCMGDHEFFFRIRGRPQGMRPRHSSVVAQPVFYFGTVYFRQVPDETSRRGYLQKSLVILSTQPCVGLYAPLVSVLAAAFFTEGYKAVESACRDICTWPAPVPGTLYSLPFLDLVFEVLLPASSGSQESSPHARPGTEPLLASLHAVNLYTCLKPILPSLHLLWELMLTAEPIVVVSPSPVICSKVVLALLSMLSPLDYCGDFRPYFTIHCPESRDFSDKARPVPPAILGVTNPVFEQALAHWPHTVRVGRVLPRTRKTSAGMADPTTAPMSTVKLPASKMPLQGLDSDYKPLLEMDKDFLRQFMKPAAACTDVVADINRQNNFVRSYFSQMTHAFLIPLEQFITRQMPLKRDIAATRAVPQLPEFHARNFLRSLEESLPQLQRLRKGNWPALYGRFLKSCNFRGWLKQREAEANNLLLRLYLEAVAEANLELWAQRAAELEIVDLLVRVRDASKRALNKKLVSATDIASIQAQLAKIVSLLPDDLQRSLNMQAADK